MKTLLDSRVTGLIIDKKFVEKHSFKLEKLNRPIEVKNINRSSNSRRNITHKLEYNMFYKGHSKRLRMDVCDLKKTKIILGILWLAIHNPEIN